MSLNADDVAALHKGLEHFRQGDYFAVHDDWEEVWQGLRGRRRVFWQAMIQLVVGAYHYTHGNLKGCQSQWHKALHKCDSLGPMYETAAPEQVPLLQAQLQTLLAILATGDDPLPAMQDFAQSVMSEQWFALA